MVPPLLVNPHRCLPSTAVLWYFVTDTSTNLRGLYQIAEKRQGGMIRMAPLTAPFNTTASSNPRKFHKTLYIRRLLFVHSSRYRVEQARERFTPFNPTPYGLARNGRYGVSVYQDAAIITTSSSFIFPTSRSRLPLKFADSHILLKYDLQPSSDQSPSRMR